MRKIEGDGARAQTPREGEDTTMKLDADRLARMPAAKEFARHQREFGMTDTQLAHFLCVDARNVRRWKRGQQDIPLWIEKFLPVFVALDQHEGVIELQKMAGLSPPLK